MKRFTLLFLLFAAISLQAQITNQTMTWGGQQREYLQYIPQSCLNGASAPVMFCLHELGGTAQRFADTLDLTATAEEKGYILVYPQALEGSVMGTTIGTFWNVGITVSVYGLPIAINADVDDTGFMMAILDGLQAIYPVNTDSVFFAGFSLGGFMSQRMAIEHGDRINAIASVSGTIGNDLQNSTPIANVNVLHIHGTDDAMIGYNDGSFSFQQYGTFVVGLGAEATVDYWRNFNHCDNDAVIEDYPDTHEDGLTFQLKTYNNGDNGSRVAFMKVQGGTHDWYFGENHDVDYADEIIKFFSNTMDPTHTQELVATNELAFYPNPAKESITFSDALDGLSEIHIYNLVGAEVLSQKMDNSVLNISSLANGTYIIRLSGAKSQYAKLVVNR